MSETEELAQQYIDLTADAGRIAKQRDELKALIEERMEAGELCSAEGKALVWEFRSSVKFEWERAVKEGAISAEVLKAYSTPQVTRALYARNRDDDGKQAEQQRLQRMLAAGKE